MQEADSNGKAPVITFAIQFGTPGFTIAHMVAEELGYEYYDSEITSRAAELSGISPDRLCKRGVTLSLNE